MFAMGIDIGTTSVCGVVIDLSNGAVIQSRTENSRAFLQGRIPEEKIQSVEKIVAIAREMVDGLLREGIAAIGVTGQMHGIVYTDRAGRAVSPLYTWQDERGNLPYQDTTYADYLGSRTGYGNVTDFYHRENGSRPRDAVSYCTIQDYFVMTLCGRKAPLLHVSDAASFGLFDLKKNTFDYDCPAEVTAGFQVAGCYRSIPVAVAIGDNQASVFSTLAQEEDLLINVGTGSQVSIVTGEIFQGVNIESRPYFDGKYLVVGAALCGGRAYAVLRDFYAQVLTCFGFPADNLYSAMTRMLENKEETTLRVDTRFAGTRANPALHGSIRQITPENFTPAELTRGVLEGMIDELAGMYGAMNVYRKGLVGSGNGLRLNPALQSIAEGKFGGKMKIPAHLEEAAYGAALFSLVACGQFQSAAQAQRLIRYRD